MEIDVPMHLNLPQIFRAVAGTVFALLGFSGCNEDPGQIVAEYGMPFAQYKLDGTVKDQSGHPAEGVSVQYRHRIHGDYYFEQDFVTDASGQVSAATSDYLTDGENIQVVVNVKDTLKDDRLVISFDESKKDRWCIGEYSIRFDTTLKGEIER